MFPLSLIRPDAGRTGDAGLDPDTQYLTVGTAGFTCMKPFAMACGQWKVTIGVPPSLFVAGVVPLCDPRLQSVFSESEQDSGAGACGNTNGRFWGGTLEILSITDETVTFRLSNTYKFGYDADGTYAASRCH